MQDDIVSEGPTTKRTELNYLRVGLREEVGYRDRLPNKNFLGSLLEV